MVVSREQHNGFEMTPFAGRYLVTLEREGFDILSKHLQDIFHDHFRFRGEPIHPDPDKSPFGNQVIIDRRLSIENNGGEFIIEHVHLNGNGGKKNGKITNNALLNYLLKASPQERQPILEYLKDGGSIMCLRRVASSDAFRQAYKLHSDTFDAGYSPVTEALAILLALDQESPINLPHDQIMSFQNLQELSSTSVHFIPLTENKIIIDSVEALNKKADPLEIIHDIHVAQKEINDTETRLSVAATITGGIAGGLLDQVSNGVASGLEQGLQTQISAETATKIGKGSAMVLAHALSELFTILQTRADTLKAPSLNTQEIQRFIKQMAVSLKHLPPQTVHSVTETVKSFIQHQNINDKIVPTLMILIPIILGVGIAQTTGFLPAFFAVAPFNTIALNARELRRRRKIIDKELKDYSSYREFIESFIKARYSFLSKIPYVNKSIARQLAILDMYSSNKVSLGSLIGTTLAFPLLWLYSTQPESSRVKDEFLYVASAILSEQVSGIVAGGIGKIFDPWDKFGNFVQIIDRLKLPNNGNSGARPVTL